MERESMPKGMFTQTACLLLEAPLAIEQVEEVLEDYKLERGLGSEHPWEGADRLLVPYRPEADGWIMVDVVKRPWPDEMGGDEDDRKLMACWMLGHFGSFTHAGSLERAIEQAWHWEAAERVAMRHASFLRLRCWYNTGGDGHEAEDEADLMAPMAAEAFTPPQPDHRDAPDELGCMLTLARRLMRLPGVLCYFNPGGEVVADDRWFDQVVDTAAESEVLPLALWSNVRLFRVNDDWLLMDTVGNGQLGLPDVEAGFHGDHHDPNDVGTMLRHLSWYLHRHGDIIDESDRVEGAGDLNWSVRRFTNALVIPPRPSVCLLPEDGREPPVQIFNRQLPDEEREEGFDDDDDDDEGEAWRG